MLYIIALHIFNILISNSTLFNIKFIPASIIEKVIDFHEC